MRPPSYYASLASSNSRTSGPGGSSRSSSQLRSSLAAPSSASYVTRTHLPYVSQSVLMAHCITGPGSTTRPYGQAAAGPGARPSYLAAAPRPKSLKRYTSSCHSYLASTGASASYAPATHYSSAASASYRPTNSYTASAYYKPIRLRERPLLTQLSSGRSWAPPALAKTAAGRAPSRKQDDGGWSADVGRNISRNKYLIKFRELDKRAPAEPIQLRNRPEEATAERLAERLAPLDIGCDRVGGAAEVRQLAGAEVATESAELEQEVAATEPAAKPRAKRLVKPKAAALRRASAAPEADRVAPPDEPSPSPSSPPPPPEVAPAAPADATPSSPQVDTRANNKRIRFRQYNLDDFNLLTVLGHGGWGFVMLAELKEHGACFAVKCIKKITIVEDDDFDSIMIERKVLSLGNLHPFICKLFCTFETQGYLFFVMEFCAGGDLMFHVQREGD